MNTITVNGIEYVQKQASSDLTLVRTFSAGVHVGVLKSQDGKVVVLENARRIWRWRGANTLNELATSGVLTSEYTRISASVSSVTLLDAIEIIPVTQAAAKTLEPVWNN